MSQDDTPQPALPFGAVPPPAAPVRQLHGWKDISSYLGMSVRTVQRWESDLALPVRRYGSGRSQTVHAFVDDLERWRAGVESVAAGRKDAVGQPTDREISDGPGLHDPAPGDGRPTNSESSEAALSGPDQLPEPGRAKRRTASTEPAKPEADRPQWTVGILARTLRRAVFGCIGWLWLKVG
jgi:hypothetical protein